jgi:hypothetical protein
MEYLLCAGRYGACVTTLSRFYVNKFKQQLTKNRYTRIRAGLILPAKYQAINNELEPTEYGGIDVCVTFNTQTAMASKIGGSHWMEGEMYDNDITINIKIDPNMFPQEMNAFIADIKDVLRHELEHVGQTNLPGKTCFELHDDIPFYRYLLLRHEIPAFVMGLYTKAKTLRRPLSEVIDDFFAMYIDSFECRQQIDSVHHVWTTYAMQHIHGYR